MPCPFPTFCEVGILMNKLMIRNKTDLLKMGCRCFIGRTLISWVFIGMTLLSFIIDFSHEEGGGQFDFFLSLSNDLIFLSGWLNDPLFVNFMSPIWLPVLVFLEVVYIFLCFGSLELLFPSFPLCLSSSGVRYSSLLSPLKLFIDKEFLSFMRPSWMEQSPWCLEVYRFMGETDRLNQPV